MCSVGDYPLHISYNTRQRQRTYDPRSTLCATSVSDIACWRTISRYPCGGAGTRISCSMCSLGHKLVGVGRDSYSPAGWFLSQTVYWDMRSELVGVSISTEDLVGRISFTICFWRSAFATSGGITCVDNCDSGGVLNELGLIHNYRTPMNPSEWCFYYYREYHMTLLLLLIYTHAVSLIYFQLIIWRAVCRDFCVDFSNTSPWGSSLPWSKGNTVPSGSFTYP